MIDPAIAPYLSPWKPWRLRRKMRKHAGERGLVVVVRYVGPANMSWPYKSDRVAVLMEDRNAEHGMRVRSVDKLSWQPKFFPIPEGTSHIRVALGNRPYVDLMRPSLDLDKGLVLFAEPHRRTSNRGGKAILVQNVARRSEGVEAA